MKWKCRVLIKVIAAAAKLGWLVEEEQNAMLSSVAQH